MSLYFESYNFDDIKDMCYMNIDVYVAKSTYGTPTSFIEVYHCSLTKDICQKDLCPVYSCISKMIYEIHADKEPIVEIPIIEEKRERYVLTKMEVDENKELADWVAHIEKHYGVIFPYDENAEYGQNNECNDLAREEWFKCKKLTSPTVRTKGFLDWLPMGEYINGQPFETTKEAVKKWKAYLYRVLRSECQLK